jgi:hypothetical protein
MVIITRVMNKNANHNYQPLLERRSADDEGNIIYSVYKKGPVYHLLRDKVLGREVIRDNHFLYSTLDFEAMHLSIIQQGFTPLAPMNGDDPNMIITYL